MEIRKTRLEDLNTVMVLYAHARAFMAENGNPNQWGPTCWPPEDLIRQDIARGKSYVCLSEGRIVGVFYFDQGPDIEPTYAQIEDGAWRDQSRLRRQRAGDGGLLHQLGLWAMRPSAHRYPWGQPGDAGLACQAGFRPLRHHPRAGG